MSEGAVESKGNFGDKITDEESSSEDAVPSPDGGWGWVVCFAVFLLNFTVAGTAGSNGIILLGLVDIYDESLSKVAIVSSLYIGSVMCVGPLGMILMAFNVSHRQLIISGGVIAFLSTIVSAFAPRLELLYFTYGILTGGSVGISYFAANTILASYFKKKRSLTAGIALSGGGCGVFALNYLIEKSISFYGMRGTFLLLSGLFLQFAVYGALCRPLKDSIKRKNHVRAMKVLQTETNLGFEPENPAAHHIRGIHAGSNGVVKDMKNIQEKRRSMVLTRKTTICKIILSTLFDPVILKNHGLQLLLFIYFIWSAVEVVFIFLPANAVDVGLSREEGALLMSINGIMFAVSQLVVGMIADLLHVPTSYILTISMLALTLSSVALPFCQSFVSFIICISIFAIFHGFTTVLRVVLAASILGVKNLNKTYSPVCLLIGVGYLIFPPMAGAVFDATQSFSGIFYFVGGNLFCALIGSTGIIYMQVKGKFEE